MLRLARKVHIHRNIMIALLLIYEAIFIRNLIYFASFLFTDCSLGVKFAIVLLGLFHYWRLYTCCFYVIVIRLLAIIDERYYLVIVFHVADGGLDLSILLKLADVIGFLVAPHVVRREAIHAIVHFYWHICDLMHIPIIISLFGPNIVAVQG